jgi:hypothetical protein
MHLKIAWNNKKKVWELQWKKGYSRSATLLSGPTPLERALKDSLLIYDI